MRAVACWKQYVNLDAMPPDCAGVTTETLFPWWYKREDWLKHAATTEAAIRFEQPALDQAIRDLVSVDRLSVMASQWPEVISPEDLGILTHQRELDQQLIEAVLAHYAGAACVYDPGRALVELRLDATSLESYRRRFEEARQERLRTCEREGAEAKRVAEAQQAADAAKKRAVAVERLHLLETKGVALEDLVAAAADAGLQLEIKDRLLTEFDARLARDDFDGANSMFPWLIEAERPEFVTHMRKALHRPFGRVADAMKTDGAIHPALNALAHWWFERYQLADIALSALGKDGDDWKAYSTHLGVGVIESCSRPVQDCPWLTVRGVKCFDKSVTEYSKGKTTTSTQDVTYHQGYDKGFGTEDVRITTTTTTPVGSNEMKRPAFEIPSKVIAIVPDGPLEVQVTARSGDYDLPTILGAVEKPVEEAVAAHARDLSARAAQATDPVEAADLYARAILLTDHQDAWGNAVEFLRAHYQLPKFVQIAP
jgi:hypothetical protein